MRGRMASGSEWSSGIGRRRPRMPWGKRLARAAAYAEAEGLTLGAVEQIVEAEVERAGNPMRLPTHGRALGASPDTMPAHAQGLDVLAVVDVTYALGSDRPLAE